MVVGIGFEHAIIKYINSFDEFLPLVNNSPDSLKKGAIAEELLNNIIEIIEDLLKEKNKAEYSLIASRINQKFSKFNIKTYGFSSFKSFMDKFLSIQSDRSYKAIQSREGNYFLTSSEYFDRANFLYTNNEQITYPFDVINENLLKKEKILFSNISRKMRQKFPGFSAKSYGFSSFNNLIENFLDTKLGKTYRQILDEDTKKCYLVKKDISKNFNEFTSQNNNELSSKENIKTKDLLPSGEASHILDILNEIFAKSNTVYYPYLIRKIKQTYQKSDIKKSEFLNFSDLMDMFLSTSQGKNYQKKLNENNNKFYLVKKETLLLNP